MQVKIPEPVSQKSELVSKSVCKDLSAWDLVVDPFTQPQSCDENIHLDLSVPSRNTNPSKFYT